MGIRQRVDSLIGRLSSEKQFPTQGETLNAVIPFSASLGGEPVKAELLKERHGVSLSEGLASLLIVAAITRN